MAFIIRAVLTFCIGFLYVPVAEGANAIAYPRLGDMVKVGKSSMVIIVSNNNTLAVCQSGLTGSKHGAEIGGGGG